MTKWYILDEEKAPKEAGKNEWSTWRKGRNYRIALDKIDKTRVSTIFIGIDRGYGFGSNCADPLLFETVVLGGPLDMRSMRSDTIELAMLAHKRMFKMVKEAQEVKK